uniref:Uncharacterized protein n=1 Tax=Brassica campestris TaxID=3711 RepID=M4DP51_BRACM
MRWETLLFAAAIELQKRGAMEVAGGNYTTTHRSTLRLQYCPLRIKKIQNFEEEHKHIFSQGTSTCQILRHLDMDPMTLHQLYYIADGEGDGWICIQPDNRKMVIVTDDIGVNFIAYGTKKE